MIHYHGTPIASSTVAAVALIAGHAFVSYAAPQQLGTAVEVCQSIALDNGAFSAWRKGEPIRNWAPFYDWAGDCQRLPLCDFAVIPDVIDGDEEANDRLLREWPLPRWFGAPVWHMHESLDRLMRLASEWPRVCIGSSGAYATIGTAAWWSRIIQAFAMICDNRGRPITKIHGLRMLNPKVFSRLPFASADSTNIGRNVGIDQAWKGTYPPPTKEARAYVMRARIESFNAPATFQ